ncbi:DUF1045 domain-containing protein [Azospirillum soli]|uniref:DUF1045 domain-containing protein n=1 Tax=Azospirillum soli TaxID=1304799 RepID=UPI001AE4686B|nr:DUF1045 domain-containing protein [Azospirillum soli]MBP2315409.1 putative phosphonate metabolism protein [Azospirillum soli]
MMDRRRFALYFAPEDGTALADCGWRWLGRRPEGTGLDPLPAVGLDPSHQAGLVSDARRYGFHATLKAPFRLAEGADEASLREAVAAFASRRRPFREPSFVLEALHGFLALRPRRPSADLDALANDCVRTFDRFRAPQSAEERWKRLRTPLTHRQKAQMDAWGYPYVLEDFRFHMTLTRRLQQGERETVQPLLERLFKLALAEPVEVRSLCLFTQADTDMPFVLAARFPINGTSA